MWERIPATPRFLVSHAYGGGAQPTSHGQGGMDLVALLDAWSKRQAGERQALDDCPTCRFKVTRPCRLVPRGGVQAQIREEWEHTRAPKTRFASPGAEGTTVVRSAHPLAVAEGMWKGVVPVERRAGTSCAEGAQLPDAVGG